MVLRVNGAESPKLGNKYVSKLFIYIIPNIFFTFVLCIKKKYISLFGTLVMQNWYFYGFITLQLLPTFKNCFDSIFNKHHKNTISIYKNFKLDNCLLLLFIWKYMYIYNSYVVSFNPHKNFIFNKMQYCLNI